MTIFFTGFSFGQSDFIDWLQVCIIPYYKTLQLAIRYNYIFASKFKSRLRLYWQKARLRNIDYNIDLTLIETFRMFLFLPVLGPVIWAIHLRNTNYHTGIHTYWYNEYRYLLYFLIVKQLIFPAPVVTCIAVTCVYVHEYILQSHFVHFNHLH